MTLARCNAPIGNDVTERPQLWRRFQGNDWEAFDALPLSVRRRMHEHAYDAWTVNALMLWKRFRRQTGSTSRGERRLLNYLYDCEQLEFAAFADAYALRWGVVLSHRAAAVSILRYGGSPR